jgi:hypothetical protein
LYERLGPPVTVNPSGDVLPCPTAGEIPACASTTCVTDPKVDLESLTPQSVPRHRMDARPVAAEFRGGISEAAVVAALITGNPGVTDPACSLSPYREKLTQFVESIQRSDSGAKRLCEQRIQ